MTFELDKQDNESSDTKECPNCGKWMILFKEFLFDEWRCSCGHTDPWEEEWQEANKGEK